MDWQVIAGIVLVIVVVGLGAYLRHFAKLLKETGEFLIALSDAIEDGRITPDEASKLLREAKDTKNAFIELVRLIQR